MRPADAPKSADNPSNPPDGEGSSPQRKRRRGTRGGQRRRGAPAGGSGADQRGADDGDQRGADEGADQRGADDGADQQDGGTGVDDPRNDVELPERIREGKPSAQAADKALVRRPKIGDTMPMPMVPPPGPARTSATSAAGRRDDGAGDEPDGSAGGRSGKRRSNRRGRGSDTQSAGGSGDGGRSVTTRGAGAHSTRAEQGADDGAKRSRRGRRSTKGTKTPRKSKTEQELVEQRRGRERNGKPIGRYFMAVQVRDGVTQVAVLEGRNLIEHYVSRPADDISQIHGNIYVGKVQNVLPGMEAAFVDIATPKNAVLYRGDVQYDPEDVEEKGSNPRIEDILRNRQLIVCQVTKNPIGHKGARLTQEVSLPGRYVVLIPNSSTYGISKRLPDDTRKRLRSILDRVKPAEHGLIVRTAAEHATEDELRADMQILLDQWSKIDDQSRQDAASEAVVPRAGARCAGHPRGVQRRLPRCRDR